MKSSTWLGSQRPLATIFVVSVVSRVLIFFLSRVVDLVLTDYDSSAWGLGEPHEVRTVGAHLVKWDGVHFLSVAAHEYKFENQHAFFPGLPYAIRYSGIFLRKCVGTLKHAGLVPMEFLSETDMFIVAATIITHACATLIPLLLYLLGRTFPSTMIPSKVAYFASILYCFPGGAAIFMSAPYTEAPFAFFSFLGIYILESTDEHDHAVVKLFRFSVSVFMLFIASSMRSNAFLLLLFPFYRALRLSPGIIKCGDFFTHWFTWLPFAVSIMILPVGYAIYVYNQFCHGAEDAQQPVWCNHRIPNFYPYVQEKYWGVGFLKYWQWQQWPNFLLALPTGTVIISAFYWQAHKFRHCVNWRLLLLAPYVIQLLSLLVMCLFFAHVQIISRLVTSCPLFYWHYAGLLLSESPRSRWVELALLIHCIFLFVGIVLFTNFLPWT